MKPGSIAGIIYEHCVLKIIKSLDTVGESINDDPAVRSSACY